MVINTSERMWSGVIRPVRVNKFEIEVPIRPDWNNILEEEYTSNLDVISPRKVNTVKLKKEIQNLKNKNQKKEKKREKPKREKLSKKRGEKKEPE